MIERTVNFLAGLPMTILAGIFLLFDLLPHITGGKINWPFDPAWIAVIICGIPLLYLAVWRIIYNPGISKISSALLITIAMFAALAIGDVFAAGEVAFIMSVGALLEDYTTNRAKKGLKNLIELKPRKARRIEGTESKLVPAETVVVGDRLLILPGETVPVDGKIVCGTTSVDQSVITGESIPVDKDEGDDLYCGTINRFGAVEIVANKVGEDSSLQKLIKLIEETEKKQAPMQRIADKVASWLVPLALMIAVFSYIFTGNLITAVTILVVFCPCALVLATPTAITAAIGQATKHGVIIKSGEALERLGNVDTIAFDKTGTLTYGSLEVSDVISFEPSLSKEELLKKTASAEMKSEHPMAQAIVKNAKKHNLSLTEAQNFKMSAGKGIKAEISGKKLICGNEKFLLENEIEIINTDNTLERLRKEGKALIFVAEENRLVGILALSDVLRPESEEVVSRLNELDTKTILLSGDNKKAASYFAREVGIDQLKADLLPEEKVESIVSLQNEGRKVLMVGDGVNDAPALKTADVSVAMGSIGSDITVDAADIALISDDISKLPYLKRLSNATVKTIKLSITLSMIINFTAIVLSLLGLLNPTTGALVHNAGSCFVVAIAALLYDRKFDETPSREKNENLKTTLNTTN